MKKNIDNKYHSSLDDSIDIIDFQRDSLIRESELLELKNIRIEENIKRLNSTICDLLILDKKKKIIDK